MLRYQTDAELIKKIMNWEHCIVQNACTSNNFIPQCAYVFNFHLYYIPSLQHKTVINIINVFIRETSHRSLAFLSSKAYVFYSFLSADNDSAFYDCYVIITVCSSMIREYATAYHTTLATFQSMSHFIAWNANK